MSLPIIIHTSTGNIILQGYLARKRLRGAARPHCTQSGLSLQLALGVLVREAGGDARPAAPRTLGPIGGEDGTLLLVAPH